MLKTLILFALSFLGGILYALGFPSALGFSHFIFLILGFALLFYAIDLSHPSRRRDDLFHILAFSAGFNIMGFYWIPYTLKEFGEIPVPINFLLGLLFTFIILPQLYGLFFLKRWLLKYSLFRRHGTFHIAFWAMFMTFLELVFPQEFPAHMGHSWFNLVPHLGLAPLFGATLFSFIGFYTSLNLCSFALNKKGKLFLLNLIPFALFLIINLLVPLKPYPNQSQQEMNIRMVQANIGNFMKINSEKGIGMMEVYSRYRDLSLSTQENLIPDLIIWPETAYPKLLNSTLMKLSDSTVPLIFKEIIEKTGADLYVGGYDMASSDSPMFESEYNTAFFFNHSGKFIDQYHKRILIPFGEHLPFGPMNQYLSGVIKNVAFFAQGKSYPLFITKKGNKFISAICYEILFSSFLRDYLKEKPDAQFLINLTNDSWYGDTAEPYQHQFLTHWRAVEFNIPILRSTNTGITSILYPDGSQSEALPLFQAVSKDLKLVLREREKTFFENWGEYPSFLIMAVFVLLGFAIDRKRILP